MATDYPDNLLLLQVYHSSVINLAFPDGELIQPQNPGRAPHISGT